MKRFSNQTYLFNAIPALLLALFLTQCGEKYEPSGYGEPISIESTGLDIEKLHYGYYNGIVNPNGGTFSLSVMDPHCNWIGISGRANDKDYFRMDENEEILEENWGKIKYISHSHPFEFEVIINPNNSNSDRVIIIDLQYCNSFGSLKLTQPAD